jgi:hypothetical protein
MRWVARDAATTIAALTAIATVVSLGTVSLGAKCRRPRLPASGSWKLPTSDNRDSPSMGTAPPPAVAPQVIVIPGQVMPSPNLAAPLPPPPLPPQVGVAPGPSVPPRAAWEPVWRCSDRGCTWLSGCVPHPEIYSDRYGLPGAPADPPGRYGYPEPPPTPEIYSGR